MKSRMKDTLLLIGDGTSDRPQLHEIFEANYYLLEAESVEQGILLLNQNGSCIAAVIADIPLGDGAWLKELTMACHPGTENEIPVITIIPWVKTGQQEELAFLLGAADVVVRPYTPMIMRRRLQVLVDLYSHRWHLEKLVEDQNHTIRNANQTMLDTLSAVIEHRSSESGNHVLRIRRFTQALLQELARCYPEYQLYEELIDTISSAAVLHDIGKISVPDAILNKPGKLTPEEMEVMRAHTTVGSQLVLQLEGMGDTTYLRYIYNISRYHHERWDGGGYPEGLSGDDIPICAQVVGLADAFDALTTQRVYKDALPYTTAFNMILNGECGAFSPKLLECFKRARAVLFDLAQQYADGYSPKNDAIQVPLPKPVPQFYPLDALQLSQLKYQTLLHHVNDTVVELDLDNGIYHVVYNPNPYFLMAGDASLDEALNKFLHEGIRPEDAKDAADMYALLYRDMFRENLRKHTLNCRLLNQPEGRYDPYRITLLRVNTENPSQRILLAIFHKENGTDDREQSPENPLMEYPVLYSLMNGILRCGMDRSMTILQGVNTLFPLTGYRGDEIAALFENSLVMLAHPQDRETLIAMIRSPELHSKILETEVRLQCKNGGFCWVSCRARANIGADGQESVYCNLSDISKSKSRQAELENVISRHQLIMEQSESIVFEWDIRKDAIVCSEKWKTRFGYDRNPTGFLNRLDKGTLFHPDDLPQIRRTVEALLGGKKSDMVDVRIVNQAGRYLWSRIRVATIFDDTGKPSYITGIIYDINELKSDALRMKQQAQQDSLTKLLNKASATRAVEDLLAARPQGQMAALLVLDLDNFKTVNDTHGHMYGDAVLTQMGSTLRSLFRAQDVIGRIGGDEFMIFMANVPSKEMVQERCRLVVETFHSQFRALMPDLPISVSVGGALAPANGTGYNDLFRCADEALYNAKRKGKNQFALYNPQEKYDILMSTQNPNTRIDSDEQPTMNDDSLLRFVFRSLYESRNIDATIEELISFIGTHFDVSRVYIFENNDDNTSCSNTFEWCNVGITPEKENLQEISYITDIPGWPNVYDERGVLYCTDVADLDPLVRQIVEPQGIKSMLHCAIMDRGVFRGYVGFDECTTNRLWTQGQVSTLEFLAEVLAVFLIKQRTLDKLLKNQNL